MANMQTTLQLISNLGQLAGAGEDFAKYMKVLAIAEAGVALSLGLANTASKGFPQNVPLILAFAAQVSGILASMKSTKVPDAPKFAKGGMIGGKPHSSGGTVFQGTDGSRFEAEKGEYLAVVNKKDAYRAAMLDAINQNHGVPFGKTSGYFARGGVQMPQPRTDFDELNMSEMIRETVNAIVSIPVVVAERDISDTQRTVKVLEGQGNL